jgi:menaquinone-9 beta-reductase
MVGGSAGSTPVAGTVVLSYLRAGWRTVAVMDPYDVAIIGAGPAGAVTAWLIAQRRPDLTIVVLEAEAVPRHKPCGEYLSPGGVGVLMRAGLLPVVEAAGARPVAAVAMRCGTTGPRVPFAPVLGWRPQAGHGLGVRRECFDGALQEAAASRCTLQRGRRLRAARCVGDGWCLDLSDGGSMRAGLLIGADGRGSAVRRLAGLDRRPQRRRFALVARARGIPHGDTVEMHLGPLGQIGLCPLGDGEVNLNLLLAPASTVLLKRLPRERLLRAALLATPSLRDRARHVELGPVRATGSLPQGCAAVVGDHLALVGDAAGFCDPFTGEGMSLALAEAEMLAAAVAAQDLPAYAAAFHATVGRRRRIGEVVQGLLTRRRSSEGLVGALGRLPLVARLLVADAAGYRRSA